MPRPFLTATLVLLTAAPALAGHRPVSWQDHDIAVETRQINRAKCMPDFHRLCPGQQARNNAMPRCLGHLQASVTPACAPVVKDWCDEGLC